MTFEEKTEYYDKMIGEDFGEIPGEMITVKAISNAGIQDKYIIAYKKEKRILNKMIAYRDRVKGLLAQYYHKGITDTTEEELAKLQLKLDGMRTPLIVASDSHRTTLIAGDRNWIKITNEVADQEDLVEVLQHCYRWAVANRTNAIKAAIESQKYFNGE